MSLIKKGIKAVGKAIKGVAKFVKKHWKTIAIVAAVVFTGGLATVGAAGFSGAMTAAGGGFTGFMSAVGSTMYAGVTAAAGSLGIGGGAAGSAAAAGGVTGSGLFAAMGAGGGYGLGAAGKAAAAKAAAAPLSGISPLMSSAGLPSAGAGLAVNPATGQAIAPATAKMFGAGNAAAAGAGPAAANIPFAANQAGNAAKAGGLGDLTKAALVTTGGQMLSGYAAAKAAEEEDPKGFWGVDLSGKGQDVFYDQNQMVQAPQTAGAQAPTAPLTPQQIFEMNQYAANGGRRGLMDPWAPPQLAGYGS